MCKSCAEAVLHFWPEMPTSEIAGWLFGSTCYPAGSTEQVWKQCARIKRIVGANYEAAYGLADHEMCVAMDNRGSARYWANRKRHKARLNRNGDKREPRG